MKKNTVNYVINKLNCDLTTLDYVNNIVKIVNHFSLYTLFGLVVTKLYYTTRIVGKI